MSKAYDQRPGPRETTKRACLGCGDEFNSEGIHHRICLKCKNKQAWSMPSSCMPLVKTIARGAKKRTSQY